MNITVYIQVNKIMPFVESGLKTSTIEQLRQYFPKLNCIFNPKIYISNSRNKEEPDRGNKEAEDRDKGGDITGKLKDKKLVNRGKPGELFV